MSAALQRKVHKLLDGRNKLDKPELREALQSLSALHESTSSASSDGAVSSAIPVAELPSSTSTSSPSLTLHRNFRSLIDSQSLSYYRLLLAQFDPICCMLKHVDDGLELTEQTARRLALELEAVKRKSDALTTSVQAIKAQQEEVEMKSNLVNKFLEVFALSSEETSLVTSDDPSTINPAFFDTMEKLQRMKKRIEGEMVRGGGATSTSTSISSDSSLLISSPRISLDLLDSVSNQLEGGYEKLYRSIQHQLANSLVVNTADLNTNFVQAFDMIRNVPVFFDHCLSALLSSRRSLLVERFLRALSRGSGGNRPLDMSSGEPARYSSDILSWIHQAIVHEKEFLATLFPTKSHTTDTESHSHSTQTSRSSSLTPDSNTTSTSPTSDDDSSATDIPDHLKYLSSVFSALSRPLRSRIEPSFAPIQPQHLAIDLKPPADSHQHHPSSSSSSSVANALVKLQLVHKLKHIVLFYRHMLAPIMLPPHVAAEQRHRMAETEQQAWNAVQAAGLSSSSSVANSTQTNESLDLLSTLSLLFSHAHLSFLSLVRSTGIRLVEQCQCPLSDSTIRSSNRLASSSSSSSSSASDSDLSPPTLLMDWMSRTQQLLQVAMSSMEEHEKKVEECEAITLEMMKPLVTCAAIDQQQLNEMIEEAKQNETSSSSSFDDASDVALDPELRPPSGSSASDVDGDRLIYALNILHSFNSHLQLYANMLPQSMTNVRRVCRILMRRLQQSQTLRVLARAGLDRAIRSAHVWERMQRQGSSAAASASASGQSAQQPLSRMDGMDPQSLIKSIQTFYSSLLSVGAFLVPQCDRLLSSPDRRAARLNIARQISAHYRALYRAILDPNSAMPPNVKQALIHAPTHVDLLLDLKHTADRHTTQMADQATTISQT